MGSRAHTSRAWEYGRNMLKKGQEYRRLGDMGSRPARGRPAAQLAERFADNYPPFRSIPTSLER